MHTGLKEGRKTLCNKKKEKIESHYYVNGAG